MLSPKLLIAADDLTGALDTGVRFAKEGISTAVLLNTDAGLRGADVVVVNTESRHLSKEAAEEIVFRLTERARLGGTEYFYKKTDSALRGNIGAELTGMLRASKERLLAFIPAYPQLKRITDGGIHYIDGEPAAHSVFGKDPFEPVTESNVKRLIQTQSREKVCVKSAGAPPDSELGIVAYDAKTDEDLQLTASRLKAAGVRAFAGCAGFAPCLASLIGFERTTTGKPGPAGGLFVITGSLNKITLDQMQFAKNAGFPLFTLSERQKTDGEYAVSPEFHRFTEMLIEEYERGKKAGLSAAAKTSDFLAGDDSGGCLRKRIAALLGAVAAAVIRKTEASVMIIGGDVLGAALAQLGVDSVSPVDEPQPGTVMLEIEIEGNRRTLFTKSGGFGEEDAVVAVERYIKNRGEEHGSVGIETV